MGEHPFVLVTGGAGQVGRALKPLLPNARFLSRQELDVTDGAAVRAALRGMDAVVHLAALTDVEACERDPARAMAVNAEGTRNVVQAAEAEGARVIYISTDYVFDGRKADEYLEYDEPNPINQYGRAKLRGEQYARQHPSSTIVRSSWIIGKGKNFVRTILAAGQRSERLPVVDDQRGRPTVADDLALALAALLEMPAADVVHVAGDGEPCTWAELAQTALTIASLPGRVERVGSEEYARRVARAIAPRPKNSTLSLAKAKDLGLPLADWRSSVERYVKALA